MTIPTIDQFIAALLAVLALIFTITLSIGDFRCRLPTRHQKNGFPITRRLKARRKKS